MSQNSDTHSTCNERLAREGEKATCCTCNPHKGCTFGMKPTKTPTQNDWKKEFQGWAFDHDRRYFKSVEGKRLMSMISKFLTDARREVIEKVEKELEGLDCGFCNYEKEVKERLATLREEGK